MKSSYAQATRVIVWSMLLWFLTIASCKSSRSRLEAVDNKQSHHMLKTIATRQLGTGYKMDRRLNHVLTWNHVPQGGLVFFVFDSNEGKVVYEEKKPVRKVFWNSDVELLVQPYDRIPRETNHDYLVNVKSGERKQSNKKY